MASCNGSNFRLIRGSIISCMNCLFDGDLYVESYIHVISFDHPWTIKNYHEFQANQLFPNDEHSTVIPLLIGHDVDTCNTAAIIRGDFDIQNI